MTMLNESLIKRDLKYFEPPDFFLSVLMQQQQSLKNQFHLLSQAVLPSIVTSTLFFSGFSVTTTIILALALKRTMKAEIHCMQNVNGVSISME